MDLDDLIEELVPKKKLKKLKKKAKKSKKRSLLGLLFAWLAAIFSNAPQLEDRSTEQRASDRHSDTRRSNDRSSAEARPSRTAQPARSPHQMQQTKTRLSHAASESPLTASLQQAYEYQRNIEAMATNARVDSVERQRLDSLVDRVHDWILMIEQIVQRVHLQEDDPLLAAERKRVPAAIKRLEKQLREAKDPTLRQKLESTLDNRRKQLAQLEQAANQHQIAELKVENTLAQLGIIYSQLHSGRYIAERNGYDRLSAEINEEIHTLEDYLEAYQAL